ncbi:hypothetical protein PUATCC27989T_00516 [Phytobacter ursingii]|nr:hypothetical protein PUATCC27989T_00516 [Phytobacter ursingii]
MAISNLLNTVSGVAQGLNLSATRLILGGFEFLDFEIPTSIAIPGRQKTVTHQMIGGKRIVDVLGVEYDPITWSGIFTGSTTQARINVLEQMRDAGEVVTLTLDGYSFDVLITNFISTYEFVYRRPYQIELAVVQRNDSPLQVDALTGALNALINSDIGNALGLADIIDVQSVTDAVNTVQSAVSTVQDFATATVDTIQTVVRPIVAAQQIIQSSISSVESSLNSITTLGGIVPGNPISKTVNNLLTQADGMTRIPALYNLSNVLDRVNKNVRTGQTADGLKTITLSGGNLYQIASDQYGDATKWESLATVNGLSDPNLSGINTIVIPSNPQSTTK